MFRIAKTLTAACLAVTLSAFLLAGCGGSTRHSVDTGTAGDLYAVRLRPAPGAVGVSPRASFELSWPDDDPPPAQFDVELVRYREGHDSEYDDEDTSASSNAEYSKLTRRGDSFVWDLDIADASGTDTDLAYGGVYFVRLRAGSDEIEAAYIVSDGRAARTAAEPTVPPTTGAGIPNEPGAARRHTVRVR